MECWHYYFYILKGSLWDKRGKEESENFLCVVVVVLMIDNMMDYLAQWFFFFFFHLVYAQTFVVAESYLRVTWRKIGFCQSHVKWGLLSLIFSQLYFLDLP